MTSTASQRHSKTLLKGATAVGFTGLALGVVAMAVLHAAAGINPALVVISATLYTPLGWLLPTSLGLFAVGATAFGVVARAMGAPRWMSVLLYVWSGLIALVALFPTDPPGTVEYSAVHFVHRYAAFAAFCTMIALGFAFSRWVGRTERAGRVVAACSWVAVVALMVTSLPYALAFVDVPAPWWTDAAGLNQRLTVGSELVALSVLGGWLRRGTARSVPAAVPAPVREPRPERVLAAA